MKTHALTEDRRITLLGVAGFAAALAVASQVAIPIPGTPVPFTLQPLLVVLAGMMLGPSYGAASMLVYLAAGLSGLPVFAPIDLPGAAHFLGPTAGYLLAYPAAAYVSGVLVLRTHRYAGRVVAALGGVLVIYLGGVAGLTVFAGGGLSRAVVLGVLPFAAPDAVKALIAAAITRSPASDRAG